MTAAPSIKTVWDGDAVQPRDVQDFARATLTRFDTQPTRKLLQFNALYTEPMYLALDKNPMGIVCLRVRPAQNAEAPVLSGSMVSWVWDGTRAKVTSIDGMSVGSGVAYTFTFEAVFAPQVGS